MDGRGERKRGSGGGSVSRKHRRSERPDTIKKRGSDAGEFGS